jgi:hypothetical protein
LRVFRDSPDHRFARAGDGRASVANNPHYHC